MARYSRHARRAHKHHSVRYSVTAHKQDKFLRISNQHHHLNHQQRIGGLALLTALQLNQRPKQVTFTDADPAVLQVCRRNCSLNVNVNHEILELKWGEALPESMTTTTYQTVLATDAIYDIGMLPPLFTTAALCLSSAITSPDVQPYFVLSHVPRACYTSENPPVEDLELHIIERDKEYGFALERIIRTNDTKDDIPADALNNTTLSKMYDVGAAILLVFRMEVGSE